MALIALMADTHLGASNNNNYFLNYHKDYFLSTRELLIERGVTDLIIPGDLYDVRKSINIKTLKRTSEFFTFSYLDAPFKTHIVVGNHDSYHKDSLKVNAPRELLAWSDFKIYDTPQEIFVDGLKIAIIPWICKTNASECLNLLDTTSADVCIGHFDIAGFSMTQNIINTAGLSRSLFKKFKRTFSGHFHIPSNQDNIIYIGSPYQLSWNDYDIKKRIILYDTETDTIEYIYNEKKIFEKIFYTDGMTVQNDYHDKIVKVYASGNYDPSSFDLFVESIIKQEPHKLTAIETADFQDIDDIDTAAKKETMEFLVDYIEIIDYNQNVKESLKGLMLETYNEAQEAR